MPLPKFDINPYVQPYVGGISKEFKEISDRKIQQFEAAADYADVLSYQNDSLKQYIAPFENDQNIANELIHGTRKNIETWATKGDYENMGREIKRSAREFARQSQPLLDNQKAYSGYVSSMKEAYQKGTISLDTYNKSLAASLNSYKGLDINNIEQTRFKGFTPSPDESLSSLADKFIEGWKADGGSKLVYNPTDGSYTNVKWEKADENQIAQAVQEFFGSDNKAKSYVQTQVAIGNQDRISNEVQRAILDNVRKHGFYKEEKDIKWEPDGRFNNRKLLQNIQNLAPSPSSPTSNTNAVSPFEDLGLEQNTATGLFDNGNYSQEGDRFYVYKDKDGKTLNPTQLRLSNIKANKKAGKEINFVDDFLLDIGGLANTFGVNAIPEGVQKIEVSKAEVEGENAAANNTIRHMAADRFLLDKIQSGVIKPAILNNPEAIGEYLRIHRKEFDNAKYLVDTKNLHDESLKNNQVLVQNKRWDISKELGAANPEYTSIKDDDLLANATGQSVALLDTELGGPRKGQLMDVNSMMDLINEKFGGDDTVIKFRRLGPMQYNPHGNKPAVANAAVIYKKDEAPKAIEFSLQVDDPTWQPVQDIYTLANRGIGGEVDFNAPNSKFGNFAGSLRLRTSPIKDNTDGKIKPAGFVEILDSNGNKIVDPRLPQNIPIQQFGEFYKTFFVPNLLDKYLAK